jgi:hypothetical protein
MNRKSYWTAMSWKTMPGAESPWFLRQALTRDDGRLSEKDVYILLGPMIRRIKHVHAPFPPSQDDGTRWKTSLRRRLKPSPMWPKMQVVR